MRIFISEKLSEHKYKTPEGYLICTDAILARTGKQEYTRGEVFGVDCKDAESLISVDRAEKEVFSDAALASFENKPITVEHPDEDVNIDNYKDYAVGFVRDVRRGEYDGQPVMIGNLVITDAKTIEEIENGEHTDLSCGYDCDILDEENPQQRNIRGNHVALCQQGRAGIAKIVDSKIEDDETVDYKGIKIGVLHTSIGTLYEVRYNKNKADWPEYKKLENAKKYIDIFLTKGEQAANASWKIDDTIVDSVAKDDGLKVYQVRGGYAIVPLRYWKTYKQYSFVERVENSLDSARYTRWSLERCDRIDYIIIDCTQSGKFKIVDSINDKLVDLNEKQLSEIESMIQESGFRIEKKGKTYMGAIHYQVISKQGGYSSKEDLMKYVKKLEQLDDVIDKKYHAPMTFNVALQNDGYISAGIDIREAYIKDSCQNLTKITKIMSIMKKL